MSRAFLVAIDLLREAFARKWVLALAIGITLTESDSIGGRSLADREQDVTRRLAQLARARGLRMDYAGDDPARFGLSESPRKRDGIAQTTWIVLSP